MLSAEDQRLHVGIRVPLVSIVVICFNDSVRLKNAVRSVLEQTLLDLEVIIVDDFSSDATPEVAQGLIRQDSRVRYTRLQENSGGCSLPRNTGFAEAAGRFIMFLDSDDVLTRDACALLTDAAAGSNADVVAGRLLRVHQESKATEPWYDHLYETERVYGSLADRPELVFDTVATNKLYRTDFLRENDLQFPLGMLYEDVVFTAEVFKHASAICYLPDQVYEWRLYDDETRQTITNQRTVPSNYSDRALAVERVRDIYKSESLSVQVAADVKALRHHFTLHLQDAPSLSDDKLAAMLAVFAPVVAQTLPQAVSALTPFERLRFAAVLLQDVQSLRTSLSDEALGLASGNHVTIGNHTVWKMPQQSLPPGSPALSFLELGTATADPELPLPYRHAAVVTSVTKQPRDLKLWGYVETRGHSAETLGELRVLDGVRATGRSDVQVDRDRTGQHVWQASLPGIRGHGVSNRTPLTMEIRLKVGDSYASLPVFLDDKHTADLLPDTSLLGRVLGDRWRAKRAHSGLLEFHIAPGFAGRLARKVLRFGR